MLAIERRNNILHIIQERGHITTAELCKLLAASPATIRNDLHQMSLDGLINKTHGGATALLPPMDAAELAPDVSPGEGSKLDHFSFKTRENQNSREKEAIAAAALQYIQDNQCILLDASSTALTLAKKLANRFHKLLVVTNGIYTMLALKEVPNIDVIIIGGMISKNSGSVEGLLGTEILNHIHIDLAFISSNGFTEKEGMTDFNLYEVELKKKMLQSCNRIIGMIDSSKFERISSASFLAASNLDILLTDPGIRRQDLEKYTDSGLNIKVCPYTT